MVIILPMSIINNIFSLVGFAGVRWAAGRVGER